MDTRFDMIADNACSFLERQLTRLSSVASKEEAEYVMHEVSRYAFPQINGSILYDTPLVRCVKINKEKEGPKCITGIKRFSYPASKYVINPGRMNITSVPVFYSANDIKTSLLESSINEGDDFYAGVWTMADDARMMVFPCIPYNLLCKFADNEDEKYIDLKKCVDHYPSLRRLLGIIEKTFSTPYKNENASTMNKYIYYLSGAIGHSIINMPKPVNAKTYQTDAIMYPSVKMNSRSYNLAIRPKFVDQHMKLLYVVKGKLHQGRVSHSIDYVGFNESGTIVWKQMRRRIKDLHVTMIENEQGVHSPSFNESIYFNGMSYTIPMFESYARMRLNNSDSQLKQLIFHGDKDIEIMNPTWIKSWVGDINTDLILELDEMTKVQLTATINSFFSADEVHPENVFNFSHP